MLSTWLTERFDLRVPVICAPMGGVAGGRLAAAVSEAGALGMVGFASGPADRLEREAAVASASGRPFGIGLLAWVVGEHQPELVDVAIAARPALVSLSYGDYAPFVARLKDAGIVVATQAGTVADACAAVAAGVDLVVARGSEGGGHGRGEVATLPLLQGVLDAVDVPVVAGGGVATARGLAAVLAAGAVGAWAGTAFLACPEGDSPARSRAAVLAAAETDTIYTNVIDIGRGAPWPHEFGGRAITNAYARRWHGREDELRQAPEPMEDSVVWAGQAVGLVREERTAADVVADLARAEDLLRAFVATS